MPYYSLDPEWFEGRNVWHYFDNQGSLYGAINGGSRDPDANRLIMLTLLKAAKLNCRPWFDYAPSKSNIADLPTRPNMRDIAKLDSLGPRAPRFVVPYEDLLDCDWSELTHLVG